MTTEHPTTFTWLDKPANELTRAELHEVIGYLHREIDKLRDDRDRWKRAGDPVKYLMDMPPGEVGITPDEAEQQLREFNEFVNRSDYLKMPNR